MDIAQTLNRMTLIPFVYDTVIFRFAAATPSGGVNAVTLDSMSYTVFQKGEGETDADAGYSIVKDFMFTNLYKNGGVDKTAQFQMEGVGIQFLGQPFIATAGITSGDTVTGTLIDAADHAEALANLVLMQTYIKVGGDEEDCASSLGPTGFWGYGSEGLGDNAVSPRLQNAIMGNERTFRYAVLSEPVARNGDPDNPVVHIMRSARTAYTYSATGLAAAAAVVCYAANVVAFGTRG